MIAKTLDRIYQWFFCWLLKSLLTLCTNSTEFQAQGQLLLTSIYTILWETCFQIQAATSIPKGLLFSGPAFITGAEVQNKEQPHSLFSTTTSRNNI